MSIRTCRRAGRAPATDPSTALAWGLDGFDFYLYVYALPAIISTFALSASAGGLLATYTLVASSIGGVAAGTIADRFGRRSILMISIAWYALFTFLSGLSQNYAQLATFRALEGLGLGAEWAVGSVLMAEWARADMRGRTLGFMQSAWAVGWLAANLAFQIVRRPRPIRDGAISFFWVSCPHCLFCMCAEMSAIRLRSRLPEFTLPRVFARPFAQRSPQPARNRLANGILCLIYLDAVVSDHAAPHGAGYRWKLFVFFDCRIVRWVFERRVHQRCDRAAAYVYALLDMFGADGAAVFTFVVADWQLLIAGPVLGFFASGVFSGFGPYLSELFPSTVRGAAQGYATTSVAALPALVRSSSARLRALRDRYGDERRRDRRLRSCHRCGDVFPETRGAELRA